MASQCTAQCGDIQESCPVLRPALMEQVDGIWWQHAQTQDHDTSNPTSIAPALAPSRTTDSVLCLQAVEKGCRFPSVSGTRLHSINDGSRGSGSPSQEKHSSPTPC
ncbi:hypothetical protein GWK47_050726 [Chionoecetes opilio]|uniref:Uncharacterized protein n=1 Tax=Chionoecetes opilio TaxID=41210 RepID=A0A8J5CTK1_CHIOP|nr:hypothetical protein GWK47_050726 [Chionoecetes opilio]